jgi:hypothetical protein
LHVPPLPDDVLLLVLAPLLPDELTLLLGPPSQCPGPMLSSLKRASVLARSVASPASAARTPYSSLPSASLSAVIQASASSSAEATSRLTRR